MNELYTGARNDAHALNALAATLGNGQSFAEQICRKVARLIADGDGRHLNLRYSEIQGVAVSCPQTGQAINGLMLIKLGNSYADLVKAAQDIDRLAAAGGNPVPIALEIGAAINKHPFTLATIAAQHKDDVETGELRRDDTPGLHREWREHHQARGQRRHPDQVRYGLQFVQAPSE